LSSKIEGNLIKTLNYTPYNYTIFFQKPLFFSKQDIQVNSPTSKKLYNLITATEKKSALDPMYWETKILHQINNTNLKTDFEKNFINLVILSQNNVKKKKELKIYYLRNIPRFSKEVGDAILIN
jgi:hypothetical protein